jgi:hypothetical protein
MTDEARDPDADAEGAPDEVENEPSAAAEPETATTDPDELMKQKYRDAMAHKHGASGAAKQGHGEAGPSGHAQSAAQTQRMFRRKSGG